jgi:hypothetical protein
MAYDSVEGKYSYQTLDSTALQHQPCSTCDFDVTLKAWQALPRSVKQAASKWVDDNFSHQVWHLHAAMPIQNDIRTTRRFLQKAVLGAVAHQSVASIMLVFSSTEKYVTSETDSAARSSVSSSSDSRTPKSDSGASRVDLSHADMEQMREWLTTKGLSAAKIAELEALVVKQKESAAAAAATQASMPNDQNPPQDDNTGRDQTYVTEQAGISHQGSGSHVRFVSGDVAPSTRHRSDATTIAPRGSNTYDRGHAIVRRPEPYRTSTQDGPRQDHREHSPPTLIAPYGQGDTHYVDSHKNAYGRRSSREPNRTRTEDDWAYWDRRPVSTGSHENRNRDHGVRTRTADYPTPVVNIYHDARQDSNVDGDPPSRPVRSSSRDHRNELAEISTERRGRPLRPHDRGRYRGGSDTSSISRDRHRSERQAVRHEQTSLRRPVQIIERSQPANQERREVFTTPYRPYSDYSPYQRIYPSSTQPPRFIDPEIFSIPRQLSPEPMVDDASDAEDAALDDAELKNKMLVKYTGGTVANTPAGPGRMGDKPHSLDAENDPKVATDNAADAGAENDAIDDPWGFGRAKAAKKKKKKKKKSRQEESAWRPDSELEPVSEPEVSVVEPASQTIDRPPTTTPIPGVQVSRHRATVISSC